MAGVFRRAPELAEIARELIGMHHDRLRDIRIEYCFGEEAPVTNGRVTLCKVQIISGVQAELARLTDQREGEPFFVMVTYDDVWPSMNDCQRRALVDHGLTHCERKYLKNGSRKIYLKSHDVEEFSEVVERHGLWSRDVQKLALAIKRAQLSFPHMVFDEAPAEESGVEDAEATPADRSAEYMPESPAHILGRIGSEAEDEEGEQEVSLAASLSSDPPAEDGGYVFSDGKPVPEEEVSGPIFADGKWVECPECKGLAKRRGKRATCGCGWTVTLGEAA